jgi:hypothetical protein
MLKFSFNEHPNTVGETYWEHMVFASKFGACMLMGSLACFVHAVFPFWFTKTGSTMITRLHERVVLARHFQKTKEIIVKQN